MKTLNDILKLLVGLQHIELFVIDLFCGAGGLSEGVEQAVINGKKCAKVVCCVNHLKNAILSHNANIPDALHFIEDIRTLDLTPVIAIIRRIRQLYPDRKIMLHASLECTNFSKAKGGQSRDADSRTLAEHLFRYIEAIEPDFIQVENVEEFMSWGPLIVKTVKTKEGALYCPCNVDKIKSKKPKGQPRKVKWELSAQMIPDPDKKGIYYERWIRDIKKYGYQFEKRILNSADFGARTSRSRFFGIFAKEGLPIVFPEPTHSKDGSQDLFTHKEKWLPVRDVLNLEDEGCSIFGRKKQLAENTFQRHKAGLIKFVGGGKEQHLIKWNAMNRSIKCIMPINNGTLLVGNQSKQLGTTTIQYLTKYFSGHPDSKNISILGPAHTIKTIDNHALVTADFIESYYGNGSNVRSVMMPCPTVTTKDRFNLVQPLFPSDYNSGSRQGLGSNNLVPYAPLKSGKHIVPCQYFDMQYSQSRCTSLEQPAGSVVGNPKHCLVTANRWLLNTNYNNVGSSLAEPSPVITANRKWHYLVNPQYASAGGSIDSPCFTLIARMDKRPPSIATCETVVVETIPSFVKITPVGIIYEIYEDDLPVIQEIKEIMALYGIIDIKQRMLKIPELKQIMGFSKNYVLVGSQADQKKFIGNAIHVKQAKVNTEALCRRLVEDKQALHAA